MASAKFTSIEIEGDAETIALAARIFFSALRPASGAAAQAETPALPEPASSAAVLDRSRAARRPRMPREAVEPCGGIVDEDELAAESSPAPARTRHQRGALLLECREKAGQFSVYEAARIAGCSESWVRKSVTDRKDCCGFHFRVAPPEEPAEEIDDGDTGD